MVTYKVFYKNYDGKRGEYIGTLPEKRKDLRGKTTIEAGMKWARLAFGNLVKDKQALFVVPGEVSSDRE
jgi:hypothetical protein